MTKRKTRHPGPRTQRDALRLLARALAKLESTSDLDPVPAVAGEPAWVSHLAPTGRALARLLLREAGRGRAR